MWPAVHKTGKLLVGERFEQEQGAQFVGLTGPGHGAVTFLRLSQVAVDQHDGHRSFADRGRDPLGGLGTHIAGDEHTRHAGFQVVRRPFQHPAADVAQIRAGQDEAVVVAGEYAVEPNRCAVRRR